MTAFTFFWNNDSWDEWAKKTNAQIKYVAGQSVKPFSEIKEGDEIFVVKVEKNCLFVGGRLIASAKPIDMESAKRKLFPEALIKKEAYVIADPSSLDIFRSNVRIDADEVRRLEVIGNDGVKFKKFTDRTFQTDFLNAQKITESSAIKLRTLLSLSGSFLVASDAKLEDEIKDREENVDPEEVKNLRAILTRRGQPEFRKKLLAAYGRRCCFSGCDVEDILEAAHIQAHAENINYSTSNGLLLRTDLHTLFDLHLIGVDEWSRIKVSKKIIKSEYGKLDGQKIRPPDSMTNNPSQFELAKRLKKLLDQDILK